MPLNSNHPQGARRALSARVVLVLLMALAFVLLTGLMDGGVGVTPLRMLDQPRFPLANALPGLLLAGALLALSRRVLFSFGLAFFLQVVLYGVNRLKFANLGTPLLPDDFQMISQLQNGGLHLLAGYLPHSAWPYLGLLAALAMVIVAWRMEPPLFAARTGGKRVVAGSVMALALVSMLAGLTAWTKIYNGRVLWLEPWSSISTTTHSGLVSSLVMFHLQYGRKAHQPDRNAAEQLINASTPAIVQAMQTPTAVNLPDIVVVQSESLFDPRIMKGYENSNFTPNLNRLAVQGTSGKLHVPTFGGGTIRTEFEVLTGLSLRYFDNLQFPYLQMSHKSLPSLVRKLAAHGYVTTAVHGNDPAFWNRTTAFKAIGFDHFISQSSFPATASTDGKYMTDSAMTDEIMTQLKDGGPPQFIFAISIEGHGPYDVPPANLAERDAIAVPAGITERNKLELQTYLYHIAHADAQLGRLVKLLAARQRPSLVLFYGDHLPALSNSYQITGFVDGDDMLSQAGIWLLVDPQHPTQPVQRDTASWLLPSQLLARAGIHDDPYFALTEVVGSRLAALTEAPGAAPKAEGPEQKALDKAMAAVDQLRFTRKLNELLPITPPKPSQGIAHDEVSASHSATATRP